MLLCSSLGLHDALRLAGVTLALVVLSGSTTNPWILGWQRSLDVALGVVVALVVQLLLWPSRADAELRPELGQAVGSCGQLYRGGSRGVFDRPRINPWPLMNCARRSSSGSRESGRLSRIGKTNRFPIATEDQVLMHLVRQVGEVEHHVSVVDHAAAEMGHDSYHRKLEQPLADLARVTGAAFEWLAQALISTAPHGPPPEFGHAALSSARKAYEKLRQARVGSNFGDDEILRFCTFFFSMQAVTEGLRGMIAAVALVRNFSSPAGNSEVHD